MTAVRTQLDIGDAINRLLKDVAYLKQVINSPSVMGLPSNPSFNSVTINDGTDTITLNPGPPDDITDLDVAVGTFYDQIFADVSWNAAVTGEPATLFEVELARDLGAGSHDLLDIRSVGGNSIRFAPLEPDTDYSVRVTPLNRIGKRGNTSLWFDFTTGHDATVPPAPGGVTILRGATSVIVKFTGLTAVQAPDVANGNGIYEIQIDTVNTFNSGNLRTKRTTATIDAFADVTAQGNWYARVAAIDSSGNQGAWSAIAGPTTAGGVIDTMILAGLDAAKITVGVMDGDHIDVNSLKADRLETSTMTATTITIGTGGQFKIGDPGGGVGTSGIWINDQGIRLNKDGVPVITLDALTGNGTFTGDIVGSNISGSTIIGGLIQTDFFLGAGVQGIRLGGSFEGIEIYTGHPSETTPGKIIGFNDSGTPVIRIEGSRTFGGSAPMPYIDLKGGNSTTGNIDIVVTGQLNLGTGAAGVSIGGGTGSAILNGNPVLLRYSGIDMQRVDSTGINILGNMWMTDRPIFFRAASDTNHYIQWLGSPDRLEFGTSTEFKWQTGGFYRMYLSGGGLDVQTDYIYVRQGKLRLGEAWGASGIYRPDAGNIGIGCSNGYVTFMSETNMNRLTMYLKDSGDTSHRVYWHSGWDGTVLVGWNKACVMSIAYDVQCDAGYNASYTRSVNIGENAWKDVAGANIAGYSDPRSKESVRTVERKEALAAIRRTKPIRFEWQPGFGDNFVAPDSVDLTRTDAQTRKIKALHEKKPKTWLGLSALEVPEDMQYDMPIGQTDDGKGINVMSAIAYCWGGLGDLADQHDDDIAAIRKDIAEIKEAIKNKLK